LESPEEPASLLAGLLDLLDGHVGTKIGSDVEAALVANSDLDDGPANPEARAIDLLQDVEVALSLAGKSAVGSTHDVEVDAGHSRSGGAAWHG
jgi:hypothetical protein